VFLIRVMPLHAREEVLAGAIDSLEAGMDLRLAEVRCTASGGFQRNIDALGRIVCIKGVRGES
jgi:hypothetical protein